MGFLRAELGLVFVFLILCLSLFQLECEGEGEGYPPSINCVKQECAPYQVIHSQKEFEIRSYNKSYWISTPVIASESYNSATRDGFIILFNYIRGGNRENVNIDMTAPVLIDILKNSSFKVNLYVAKKFQKIPLPPAYDDRVKAIKLPVYNFAAVRRFSGFIDDANIASELLELKKSLQSTRWQSAIASNAYAAADYNPPWQLQFRVNEIILWFGNTD